MRCHRGVEESKQQTANLVHLFAYTDTLLHDRLNKLMRVFKDTEPDFYGLYFNARNVINTAARKRKTNTGRRERRRGEIEEKRAKKIDSPLTCFYILINVLL
jgi:hypothetical protein